jgi:hypothetical protein
MAGLAIPVHAAYKDDLAIAQLQDLNNSIKHHSGNILAIRQKLLAQIPASEQNIKDEEFSDYVLSVLSEINIESETLIENQSLLGKMGSEHGKSAANSRITHGVKDFMGKCGPYLKELDLNLIKIINDDIVFEVKNARDDVVKICGIVERQE